MKDIKYHLVSFIVFMYNKYIVEDFDCMNPIFVRFVLRPAWFIKICLKWSLIFLLFPLSFARYYYDDKIEKIKEDAEKFRVLVLTEFYSK